MATKTETLSTLRDALSTARAELKTLVERGINLAERRSKALFRFARNAAKRIGGSRGKSKRRGAA